MKKLLSFLLIVFSINGYSQCQNECNTGCITGNQILYIGQTTTFTSNEIAQCSSCYDWDINNNSISSDNQTVGTIKIVNSDMGQSVQILAIAEGPFRLDLTYFDETGCHCCCYTGYVLPEPAPLPTDPCFGFDPVELGVEPWFDINDDGTLCVGHVGPGYVSPTIGLTYTWYFKFLNGDLLVLDGQYPTFREKCPTNPVKSFACVVTNGFQTKQYRCIDPAYLIPGLPSTSLQKTCFKHPRCEEGPSFRNNSDSNIVLSPNPTSSLVKFEGKELSNFTISIFNNKGDVVIKNSKIDQPLNLEKLEKGIYMYLITDAKGFKQEGKIIKE